MKLLSLLRVASAALAVHPGQSAVLSRRHDEPPVGQCPNSPLWCLVKLTTNAATTLGFLEPKLFKELGSKRVKVAYGPLLVPPASDETTHGMQEFRLEGIEMPCNDCLITNWQPDLVFDDWTTANADRQMWLHHVVFFNLNRTDVPCARFEDRFAASGNERTIIDYTVGGYAVPASTASQIGTLTQRAQDAQGRVFRRQG